MQRLLLCLILLLATPKLYAQSKCELILKTVESDVLNDSGELVLERLCPKHGEHTSALKLTPDICTILLKPVTVNRSRVNLDSTQSWLNVDLTTFDSNNIVVELYNDSGQELYWDKLSSTSNPLQFAIAGLPKGIYLLKLAYDKKQHVERIVLD